MMDVTASSRASLPQSPPEGDPRQVSLQKLWSFGSLRIIAPNPRENAVGYRRLRASRLTPDKGGEQAADQLAGYRARENGRPVVTA